jgi:coenzyme F420-reducing hydrogenase gamma subunit
VRRSRKPRIAVWKFASCDGCQLALLDCEHELLAIAGAVDIASFPEASRAAGKGPYDLSLVEGSITTPHDAERIHAIRRSSRVLVAIGACATAGGIQALRNFANVDRYVAAVYPSPAYIATLRQSTAIAMHVAVDFELRGCPVSKAQLLEVLNAFVNGRKPVVPAMSVCWECKARGNACGLVTIGPPCLGPVTQAGCGALCPTFHRGCFGCNGPRESANPRALAARWAEQGMDSGSIVRVFRGFNAWAEPFRKTSEAHEH